MLTRLITFAALILALTLLTPTGLQAQGVITVRLSYKIIRNPADGTLPVKPGATQVDDNDIDAAIATMNSLSAAYFRGFRFQRVDEISYIGDKDDTTGPSKYFNTDFRTAGSALRDEIEEAAMGNAAYAWNNQAINIYINQGTSGGYCSFPNEGRNIILVGAVSSNAGNTQLHELGHYFNLCHTHGCDSTTTDDGVADTLVDSPMWDEDGIARNSFPDKTYKTPVSPDKTPLSASEKMQVDNVVLNLMSYHGTTGNQAPSYPHPGETTQSRLTEQQLDRWTEAANGPRAGVCDGTTIFVQAGAEAGDGSSTAPYGSVVIAVEVAATRAGNNIVLLRPGVFNQPFSLNPPPGTRVTLRATRQGAAVIEK